jgi:hypothetical protein
MMARLMLSVGDFQASVQPIPGSVTNNPVFEALPDDHPLKVGDHEVMFWEINPDGGKDNYVSKICGENEALQMVAAWLQVDEVLPSGEGPGKRARQYLIEQLGEEIAGWMLP